MSVPLVIIGGGLSGLAAAIRFARFSPDVLILEKHTRIGGLNSYYYRNKTLLETGLHAITNYADAKEKQAPLNRLLRQLRIKRSQLAFHQQIQSEIHFPKGQSLVFSNNPLVFQHQIDEHFPDSRSGFKRLLSLVDEYDPFKVRPFISARKMLSEMIADELLVDMILCPLMYYGSSVENDMDLGQFIIMFQAIFLEGMFRPGGTIKDFLDFLLAHYKKFGGSIRLNTGVARIIHSNNQVSGLELESGEVIECQRVISTIGLDETRALLGQEDKKTTKSRLGFVESIFQLPIEVQATLPRDRTIIFFNTENKFKYQRPEKPVDFNSGVICFPASFQELPVAGKKHFEVRTTHLANYSHWKTLKNNPDAYKSEKEKTAKQSLQVIEKIIGNFSKNIVYKDTFTPVTIEHFTAKKEGAIYGSPVKIADGNIGFNNLFLAGTDQGFLGIIGSMLSGVSIVNQHVLTKL